MQVYYFFRIHQKAEVPGWSPHLKSKDRCGPAGKHGTQARANPGSRCSQQNSPGVHKELVENQRGLEREREAAGDYRHRGVCVFSKAFLREAHWALTQKTGQSPEKDSLSSAGLEEGKTAPAEGCEAPPNPSAVSLLEQKSLICWRKGKTLFPLERWQTCGKKTRKQK